MGILYIVATPIGNLQDITLRALEILRKVDLIACENTRHSLKLLNHFSIAKPLVSYFQHSKISKMEYIFEQLEEGKNIALVTDAGTPGISDPGGKLISQFLEWQPQLKVVSIPGPCAAITALSISGFPTDNFIFLGFPPHKKGRETFFKKIAEAEETVVFYESSHRILKALEKLKEFAPEKKLVVCRELTKMFEAIYRGKAEEILKILVSNKNNQKGEFVVMVSK